MTRDNKITRHPKQTNCYKTQEMQEAEKEARLSRIARQRRALTALKRRYEAAERISVQCK